MDDSTRELLAAADKRFDDLRAADIAAVQLAHADLSRRLEGFPQQYATKMEMEEASRSLQRLEKESLPREMYDQRHKILEDAVARVEREKMSQVEFDTFVANYRLEQERLAEERRNHAELLAGASERIRRDFQDERNNFLTVDSYDLQHQEVIRSIQSVQRWQYKLIGGLVFATFVAPMLTATVVYLLTKELG